MVREATKSYILPKIEEYNYNILVLVTVTD